MSIVQEQITLPNSSQIHLQNKYGEPYLIQISWPLHWKHKEDGNGSTLPVLYVLDGAALFLTATESAWRFSASSTSPSDFSGIIVGISYPPSDLDGALYHPIRRSKDFTPAYLDPPPSQTVSEKRYGGADILLHFILEVVRPAVQSFFPNVRLEREGLFGHSFGGLFALHALFEGNGESVWDVIVASSPSIWFGQRGILRRAKEWASKDGEGIGQSEPGDRARAEKTRLILSSGALEQNPVPRSDESKEDFRKRAEWWAPLRMCDNAVELEEVLKDCDKLGDVKLFCFESEDHSSVMGVAVGRAVSAVFGAGKRRV